MSQHDHQKTAQILLKMTTKLINKINQNQPTNETETANRIFGEHNTPQHIQAVYDITQTVIKHASAIDHQNDKN